MKGFTSKHILDQTGKTVFITGANTGLGFEAAKVLAGSNARVRGRPYVRQLERRFKGVNIMAPVSGVKRRAPLSV